MCEGNHPQFGVVPDVFEIAELSCMRRRTGLNRYESQGTVMVGKETPDPTKEAENPRAYDTSRQL